MACPNDIENIRTYITKQHLQKRENFWNAYFEKYDNLIANAEAENQVSVNSVKRVKYDEDNNTIAVGNLKPRGRNLACSKHELIGYWQTKTSHHLYPNLGCNKTKNWTIEVINDVNISLKPSDHCWQEESTDALPSTFGSTTNFHLTILPVAVKSFIEEELESDISMKLFKRYCAQLENNTQDYDYWTSLVMYDLSILSEIIALDSLYEYTQSALLELIARNGNGKI
ncbi:hypothetical protein RI129_008114 [Pyrocoelia pectoralis]|uniref:Uncharacterized protein n=1 Tax=Pyrocoelia pectoralis TaxID=417401 RepID=A0AAN7VIT2_9COLE